MGSEELVRFFLDHGESRQVSEKRGLSLLFAAAQGNLPGILKLCLESGMDVNAVNAWDQTLLETAKNSGSGEAVLYLMKNGADFEPDSFSRQCVYSGLFEVARKIYSDYPDVSYDYGKAFWNALLTGNEEVIEYYRSRVRPEEYRSMVYKSNTILHTAASGGYLPVIQELVESGLFDPLAATEEVPSAAYKAVVNSGNPEAVRFFLDQGWDPDESSNGSQALSSLMFQDTEDATLEILHLLLEAGADPLYRLKESYNGSDAPLVKAFTYGKPRVLKLFLEREDVKEALRRDSQEKSSSRYYETLLDKLIKADYGLFHGALPELTRRMLELGADTGRDIGNRTVLTDMVMNRDLTLFSEFMEYSDRPGIHEGLRQSMVLAAGLGRLRFLDKLVAAGVSPDFSYEGYSPLGAAVENGMTDAVRLLLEAGADPNKRSRDNRLPLAFLEPGDSDIRDLLIRYGALESSDQPFGSQDLLIAVRSGDTRAVKALLEKGADPNASGKAGLAPIEIAADAGDRAMAELLIAAGAELGRAGSLEVHPLRIALEKGHYDLFLTLLQKGADPCENSRVSLIVNDVIQTGDLSLIADTLQYGNLQNMDRLYYTLGERRTMLHIAVNTGDMDTVKYFLSLGASVDTPDEIGRTPLVTAAARGYLPVLELLLQAGADPDSLANELRTRTPTALMAASAAGSAPCVKLLLDAGADSTVVNHHGENALDLSRGTAVRSLLDQAGVRRAVDPDGTLANAVLYYDLGGVLDALEKGADPDALNSDGYPVLFTAVGQGFSQVGEVSFYIVDALLAYGADPNVFNRSHSTPLYEALSRLTGIELGFHLLKYGADPTLEDMHGETAFDQSFLVDPQDIVLLRLYKALLDGHLEDFKTIKEESPEFDLNRKDSWGRTLLMLAFEEEQGDIASYLIKEGADTAIKSRIFPGYLADLPAEASFLEKLSKPGMMTLDTLARYKRNDQLLDLLARVRGGE